MYFERSIEGSLQCTTLLVQTFIVMLLLLLHHVYNPSNSFCRSLSVSANNTMSYTYSNIQAFSLAISIPKSNDFK